MASAYEEMMREIDERYRNSRGATGSWDEPEGYKAALAKIAEKIKYAQDFATDALSKSRGKNALQNPVESLLVDAPSAYRRVAEREAYDKPRLGGDDPWDRLEATTDVLGVAFPFAGPVKQGFKQGAMLTKEGIDAAVRNASKVPSRPTGSPGAQAGQAPLFGGKAISPAERNPLVVTHNLKAENLRYANKELGGHLPGMSFAVTTPPNIPTNFGNITLVGRKELATPGKNARVFNADAYLPRFPQIEPAPLRAETVQNLRELVNPVQAWWKRPGGTFGADNHEEAFYNLIRDIERTKPHRMDDLSANPLLGARFLHERGRLPKHINRDTAPPGEYFSPYEAAIDNYNNLSRELTATYNDPRTADDYYNWLMGLHKRIGHKPEKQIVQTWGNQGQEPMPFSLDNLVASMTPRDARVMRGAEFDPGGLHHTRAMLASEFRTPEGIQHARGNIVSTDDMNEMYRRMADERAALAKRWGFADPHGRQRTPDARTVGFDVARQFRNLPGLDNAPTLRDKYPSLQHAPEDYKAAMQWAGRMKRMPASYYEGKAVGYAPHAAKDFEAAIVTSPHKEDFVQLERAGFKPNQIHEAEAGKVNQSTTPWQHTAPEKPGDVIEKNDRLRRLLFSLGIIGGTGAAGAMYPQEQEQQY